MKNLKRKSVIQIHKIKGENNIFNILHTTLNNRNISDIESFLSPSLSDAIHYSKLKNIDAALKMIEKHKDNMSEFAIVVDSDVDGYTSAGILYMYLKKLMPEAKINCIMHKGRANGLTEQIMKEIERLNPSIVVLPDASSNDAMQHRILHDKGIDVLCLDHHEVYEEETDFAVIVNPQLSPEYENKQISGCSVTYKFLQALDDKYGNDWADEYLDLAALSNVSDAIELVHPDVRYLTYKGFEKINNPFLKELVFKNADWTKGKLFPHVLSWSILPKLNSLIRVGSEEEKLDIFEAFIGVEREFYNTRTKKTETLPQKSARLCNNSYAKQKRIRTKLVDSIKETIESENLDENGIIFLTLDDFESGLSGYIAGGLTNVYRKPVVLTSWNDKEQMYTGSLRGHSDGNIGDVKQLLEKTGLFSLLAGHSNAAGAKITEENAMLLNDKVNSILEFEDNIKPKLEVDFELHSNSLTKDIIEECDSILKYFGKGCEQPLFAITDIEIDCQNIAFKNTTKFSKGGIEFLSFSVNKELEKLANENKTVKMTIVGTLGLNRFLGKTTHQVVIEAIQINEVKSTPSFGGFVF